MYTHTDKDDKYENTGLKLSPQEIADFRKCISNRSLRELYGVPCGVAALSGITCYGLQAYRLLPFAVTGTFVFTYVFSRMKIAKECLLNLAEKPGSTLKSQMISKHLIRDDYVQKGDTLSIDDGLPAFAPTYDSIQESTDTYRPMDNFDQFSSINGHSEYSDMSMNELEDSTIRKQPSVTYEQLRAKNRESYIRNEQSSSISSTYPYLRPPQKEQNPPVDDSYNTSQGKSSYDDWN